MRRTIFCACALQLLAGIGARASEPDALAISANIQAVHLPYGTILDPVFASAASNQIVGYTRCGDSAIWTGHYLAAESFRYHVTHSPNALKNVNQAIAGIKTLIDVTGTDVLARCQLPAASPYAAGIRSEEANNGIYTNRATGNIWIGNTSRDQYVGVLFGLCVAFDMMDDPAVRSMASDLATRLIRSLAGNAWTVVMPDGNISTTFLVRPDEILSILQIGRHLNPVQFSNAYAGQKALLAASAIAPIGVDILSDSSYFKFNLDYLSLYDLIGLENDAATRSLYSAAYDILRSRTWAHQNAFFDVIDLSLRGPNAFRDTETLALLDQWLARPKRDFYVDLSRTVPVCGTEACQPVPVQLRTPTDFLWQRNPFQLFGGGTGTIETAGIDYILPYWMARYYGLTAAFSVRSAADSNTLVAPDSIATIYGSNLALTTAAATAQPLPLSLGGIGVTVADAAGLTRNAPLLYVSPTQINFVIPKSLASGPANFTVAGMTGAITAPGIIQNVAPALFTMSGNGTGVAAATAFRAQSPVPVFQCNASGCVSVPMSLGIDAPVYLSLYGTGIRNRSALANVIVTIHGVSIPVLYAGPQPDFAGLDQINVSLPLSLRGMGDANVQLTVDGETSNAVTINIQ